MKPRPIRFVAPTTLDPFAAPGAWRHAPDVLARAAAALGYLPATWWTAGDCMGPCGVLVPCPWCWRVATIAFTGHEHGGVAWRYDGPPDAPTIRPSILVQPSRPGGCAMHVWITGGYLIDDGTPVHERRTAHA